MCLSQSHTVRVRHNRVLTRVSWLHRLFSTRKIITIIIIISEKECQYTVWVMLSSWKSSSQAAASYSSYCAGNSYFKWLASFHLLSPPKNLCFPASCSSAAEAALCRIMPGRPDKAAAPGHAFPLLSPFQPPQKEHNHPLISLYSSTNLPRLPLRPPYFK